MFVQVFSGKHFLSLPVVLRIFLNYSLTFKFHDRQIKHNTISMFRGVPSFSSDAIGKQKRNENKKPHKTKRKQKPHNRNPIRWGFYCVVSIFVSCSFRFSIVLDHQCVSGFSCGTICLTGVNREKNYISSSKKNHRRFQRI